MFPYVPYRLFVLHCASRQYFPPHGCHGNSTFHPIDEFRNLCIQPHFGGPSGLLPMFKQCSFTKRSRSWTSGHSGAHFLRKYSEEPLPESQEGHIPSLWPQETSWETAESRQPPLLSTICGWTSPVCLCHPHCEANSYLVSKILKPSSIRGHP